MRHRSYLIIFLLHTDVIINTYCLIFMLNLIVIILEIPLLILL